MKKIILAAAVAIGCLAAPAVAQRSPSEELQAQQRYEKCLREYENYLRDQAAGRDARLRAECQYLLEG